MSKRFAAMSRLSALIVLLSAGCVESPPPAPHVAAVTIHHHPSNPDWFHRQLALARDARAAHLPHGDKAGAHQAYLAIMQPTCEHVIKAGPIQYRARCEAMLHPAPATVKIARPADDAQCDLDRDDSNDTPEQITACSD